MGIGWNRVVGECSVTQGIVCVSVGMLELMLKEEEGVGSSMWVHLLIY